MRPRELVGMVSMRWLVLIALDMTDNNFMWANIECGASTITACLPTMAPLFPTVQSPESLIKSARSALSVKSSSLFSLGKKPKGSTDGSSVNFEETKRAWYELHPFHSHGGGTVNNEGSEPTAQLKTTDDVVV